MTLLDDARALSDRARRLPASSQSLAGRTVANLFFEPSTRTRASFDLAGKRLGADVLNLDVNTSSRKKGESILDTIYTLQAMHVDIMVVRDASAGVPAYIARHVMTHVSILNAGESDVSHPTQGLLDLLTIRQRQGSLRESDRRDRRGHQPLARRAVGDTGPDDTRGRRICGWSRRRALRRPGRNAVRTHSRRSGRGPARRRRRYGAANSARAHRNLDGIPASTNISPTTASATSA